MTTEEYIKNIDFEPFHYSDRVCANLNIQNFAKKAVNMARQEEREKADKAFSKVIKALDASSPKWYEELEKDFLELINK